jgi:hypothetical protein
VCGRVGNEDEDEKVVFSALTDFPVSYADEVEDVVLISSEVGGLYVNATPVIRCGDVASGDFRSKVRAVTSVGVRGDASDGERDDA